MGLSETPIHSSANSTTMPKPEIGVEDLHVFSLLQAVKFPPVTGKQGEGSIEVYLQGQLSRCID